ncbi:unnamed protein product, partial [Rotaria magnacalcarata]
PGRELSVFFAAHAQCDPNVIGILFESIPSIHQH